MNTYLCSCVLGETEGNFVFGCVRMGHCSVGVPLSPSGNSQCIGGVHAFKCDKGKLKESFESL